MQYYEILGVKRDADVATITKQYKILAQKYHPSLHPDAQVEFEKKYRDVTEAYEVLSNAKFRVIFDSFGEDGLKNGVPDGSGGMVGERYAFVSDPETVFRECFGRNPFTEYFDFEGRSRSEAGNRYHEFAKMSVPPPQPPAPEDKSELSCTLEMLYNGATLQVPVERLAFNPTGASTQTVTDILTVKIRRGLRDGTIIRFPRAGSERPGLPRSDILFAVATLPHPRFRRDGDNLHYTANITLGQALLGAVVEVRTLDDRVLSVCISDIVRPGYTKVVKGEGMPVTAPPPPPPAGPEQNPAIPTAPGVITTTGPQSPPPPQLHPLDSLLGTITGRGDLIIDFNVSYPERLTPAQKAAIRGAGL